VSDVESMLKVSMTPRQSGNRSEEVGCDV